MSVVVDINGRQAVPVRAIPTLTDWVFYTPAQMVQVLEGTAAFNILNAHRLRGDEVVAVPSRWWTNWRSLHAAALEAASIRPDVALDGYRHPGAERLSALPAGMFVWKDQLTRAHAHTWVNHRADRNDPRAAGAVAVTELALWKELDYYPALSPEELKAALAGFAEAGAVEAPGKVAIQPEGKAGASQWVLSRKGMVERFRSVWPTIGSDISSASRNGLKTARAGARMWVVERALAWARENSRLLPTAADMQLTVEKVRKAASPFAGL